MSFKELEESRYHGQPVTLLSFKFGEAAGAVAAYTDAEFSILDGSLQHEPRPYTISVVSQSGTLDRKQVKIVISNDSEIADQFKGYPPSYPISVIMKQGHYNDGPIPQFIVFWTGIARAGQQVDDNQMEITCEPIATSMQRVGLRRKFQYMCPHVLYGSKCKASRPAASFTLLPVVGSVTGNQFNLAAGWATNEVAMQFVNGVVEWATPKGKEIRTILRIDFVGPQTQVRINGPVTDLLTQQVKLSKGCNHLESDCADVHNNIVNYGGQPWIPLSQPLGSSGNSF